MKNTLNKKSSKSRLFVFLVLCGILFTLTVGYSANLTTILNLFGNVSMEAEEKELEITSIKNTSVVNVTDNGTSMSLRKDETAGSTTLVAEFNLDYYRSYGSSNMYATYEVVIYNGSFKTQILSSMTSTPEFTSSSTGTLNYTVNGVNAMTTALKPGESVTVTITFSLANGSRNTHYVVNETYEFEFVTEISDSINLKPVLNTTSVEYESLSDLKPVSITVTNNSTVAVSYMIDSTNTNFAFTTATGSSLSNFTLAAGATSTFDVYMKISDNHIFTGTTETVPIRLETTSPSILTYSVGSLSVTLPQSGLDKIIGDKTILDDNTIDFTSTSGSGLYKNTTNNEITYFYRGNVTNNYVSFAGYTWRIIRIDKYGTRIILNSSIGTAAWASSNTTSSVSLDEAISTLKYANSQVKTTVDNWYNNNLSSYSDIIQTSYFCEDMSNQSYTSSGSGYKTYYFGSYVRNGPDSSGYTPEFTCDSQYTTSYKIGLISGDEIAFAGGVFNTDNRNYYLYNSSISSYWWSLSPSYYDTTMKTMGILVVNGSTGKFHDWQNGSTIANKNAIRPVITLDTDRLTGGDGTSSNPYTFS